MAAAASNKPAGRAHNADSTTRARKGIAETANGTTAAAVPIVLPTENALMESMQSSK